MKLIRKLLGKPKEPETQLESILDDLYNHHGLYVAASGGGKNGALNYDLKKNYVGKAAIYMNLGRGDNTADFIAQLDGYPNIAVDDVSQNKKVIPVTLMRKGITPEEIEVEIDRAMNYLSGFVDGELSDFPLKWKYSRGAVEAWQSIEEWVPAYTMAYLFKPKHPMFRWWLDRLNGELNELFWRISTLHESPRISTVGAAERLIEIGFGSLAMKARDTGKQLDWGRIIQDKYVLITHGGKGCTRDGIRSVMRARNMELIYYVEHH